MKIMKIIISNVTFLIWNIVIVSRKKFCINDLKIKLGVHCVLLPYLISFYPFFFLDALNNIRRWFGFSCPYEHPFFPYFEYCFIFFLLLIYFRLYISMLIIQKKKYIFFFILYLSLFILFFILCDWYSHYQYIWDVTSQKYMYKINFNIAGAGFIYFFCLSSFLILDLFIFLFYFYPLISIFFFIVSLFFFIFFDFTYIDMYNILHQIFANFITFILDHFSIECMYSGSDLPDEKTVNLNSPMPEAKSEEALPKTPIQRAAELFGEYRYDQTYTECKGEEFSVRYTQTTEGCRVSVIQCLPDSKLSSSVNSAITNNLPTDYSKPLADHIIGDPLRKATEYGVKSSIELKENRCVEITSKLYKALEDYKKER